MANFSKIFFFVILLITHYTFLTNHLNAQLVSDFRVNDDTTNTEQYSAKLGSDSLGNFTAVWSDKRNGRSNVYCQRFNSSGAFIGTNFKININPDSSLLPNIAVSKNGKFAVCWLDVNNSTSIITKVKCRIFNKLGIPLTNDIIVNDTLGSITTTPSIGVSDMNEFIITWSHGNILYQRIDSIGNKIGNNVRVNDISNFYFHLNPAISVKQDGSFIITWSDTRPPSMANADDIYMQMYDKLGNKIGVNQRVNDDISPVNLQRTPKISSDTLNNFVISWTDNRNDNDYTEIYCQMYFNNGIKNGLNFRVTQSSIFYSKGICNVVKRPNGEYLVGWGEFRQSIPLPYFQRYTNSGIRIGNDFLVTSEFPSINKYYSDVNISGDRIISVWTDARNGLFDIYCNIRSFTNPDTTVNIIQTSAIIPEKFSLLQNYPNPFNPNTTIEFDIFQKSIYSLDIYNYLGQNVKNLFNRNLNPGTYFINFNSNGFSSGNYYYILSSPKERLVRSFVLIK